MTRYQALRQVGCGPFTAGFIALLNWLCGVPPNLVQFGTVEIELPAEQLPTCADTGLPKDPRGCWNVRCQLGSTCCRAATSQGSSVDGEGKKG